MGQNGDGFPIRLRKFIAVDSILIFQGLFQSERKTERDTSELNSKTGATEDVEVG